MKKRLKEWITNIFAITIWILVTYLFVVKEIELTTFIILLFVGAIFLFMDAKEILKIAVKLLPNKK